MITPADIFAANQVLTVAKARELKGKRIATTAPEYWMNRNKLNEFIVGDMSTSWEYESDRHADWLAKLTPGHIARLKDTVVLLDADNNRRHSAHIEFDNWYEEPTFTGSDADREVYYIVLD